jgi:Domain of unknown function (DUF4185)
MIRRSRDALVAALVVLSCGLFNAALGDGRPSAAVPITIDDSWNAVFDRHDGWTGADCAGTVNLRDGRLLWLFGDTWIGSIRDGKRLPGATMVNNSIAIHPIDPTAPWKAPDPASVRFAWGAANAGQPTAWAIPVPKNNGEPTANNAREWLWANGGGLLLERPQGTRRLLAFFFRVRTNPKGKGVWTFTVAGTTLVIVDQVAEPIDRWQMRVVDLPNWVQSKASPSKPADAEMTWGMATCLNPETAHAKSPDLLIYGIRRSGFLNDGLILARAPAAAIDHFQAWQFYAGNNCWSNEAKAAKPIANGLVSEFSVERLEIPGRPTWILVQSEPLLGKRIFVRMALKPEGPWSARKTVATIPDVERNKSYFTYAAKGHADISRQGELLITYLVNSQEFGDLVRDTTIYHPKVLRLPLSSISFP